MGRRKTSEKLIEEFHQIEDEIADLNNEWIWFRNEIRRLTDPLTIGEFLRSADRIQEKIRKKSLKQEKIVSRLEKY